MLNLDEETVSSGDKPTLADKPSLAEPTLVQPTLGEPSFGDKPSLPEAKTLEIKVQPADAIGAPKAQSPEAVGGPVPVKNSETVSKPKKPSLVGRAFRFVVRTAAVVCLCGLAWGAGVFYASGHSPLHFLKASSAAASAAVVSPAATAQPGSERDAMLSTMRQMADEISALKSSIDSKGLAQGAGQAPSAQTATGPTNADLAARVDKLDAELTGKLSQMNDQLAIIQQKVATARTPVAARAPARPRHVEHLHDAFDPAHEPGAPGSPRPLGSH